MKQVNAIGDPCPMPVIKTKKALAEMTAGKLEVLVDNEIAVQNLQRFAESANCQFEVKKQDDHFVIALDKPEEILRADEEQRTTAPLDKVLVVLSSETMGSGDDALGRILMKSFVFALTQLDTLPDAILLYNTGARLSVQGADTLQDLIALEKAGVRILTCGTCLNHFGTTENLGVGKVTNMYSIVEEMQGATRILRP